MQRNVIRHMLLTASANKRAGFLMHLACSPGTLAERSAAALCSGVTKMWAEFLKEL